jgi:Putative Na+/H+ antiporter
MGRLAALLFAFLLLYAPLSAHISGGEAYTPFPIPLSAYSETPDQTIWQTLVERAAQDPFNLVALIIFAAAIVHTFLTGKITALAHRKERQYVELVQRKGRVYREEKHVSFLAEILYFFGEVEIVFALWVIALLIAITWFYNWPTAVAYLSSRNYTEAVFVIVIMTVASTRPILKLAERLLHIFAGFGRGSPAAWWLSLLTIGPLLGSFITEPGAMTITAILLGNQFYRLRPPPMLAYATLGLLFTNISVGGILTQFAAPAVLIVAAKWEWSTWYVFTTFGWKAIVALLIANATYFLAFRKTFKRLELPAQPMKEKLTLDDEPVVEQTPLWITVVHLVLLVWIVFNAHTPSIFIGTFLLFLGFRTATRPHQWEVNLKGPLLVGLFLAGLVIHGGVQAWWISPLLGGLEPLPLFFLSMLLTTVNDNAAITYLSSLIPDFGPTLRYAVVAGAVSGGGLTVIANAPNPAGISLLRGYFNDEISPLRLFLGALIPTIIMALMFLVL